MKRLMMLFLAVILLLGLVGCGGPNGENETTTTEGELYSPVADPMTQAKLDAIPLADANMTTDQLRQICVEFMHAQNSFAWTPTAKFSYYNKENYVLVPVNRVIGGMPYISLSQGSLYNFMHFYDEKTGFFDAAAALALKQPYMKVVANQCSGATYWAWARVSNSVKYNYTREMVITNGCIPVGPYEIDPEILNFMTEEKYTKDICDYNGEQIMFQSYAQLKLADGVVFYATAGGHVQMVTGEVKIAYKKDGVTIDANNSYVTLSDQDSSWTDKVQSNGEKIRVQGGVQNKWTFAQLYKKGYLPFTIPEFIGEDDVEKAEITSSYTDSSVTVSNLADMDVTANYPMSYTTITVKDANGSVLYNKHVYTCTLNVYTTKALSLDVLDEAELKALANGKNTVEVSARVGTGEILTAYSGKFVASK